MNTKIAVAVALALASTGAVAGEKADKAGSPHPAVQTTEQEQSAAESQSMAAEQGQPEFKDLDKNGDGYISEDEASSELKDQWAELDKNTDNQLDEAEFAALEQAGDGGSPSGGVTPKQGSKSEPGMQGNKKTY